MSELSYEVFIGPGSQPQAEGEAQLDYLKMPSAMETYRMPDISGNRELSEVPAALDTLKRVQSILESYVVGRPGVVVDLDYLGPEAIDLVDQALGEGEVSVRFEGAEDTRIQESVLAGVWRVRRFQGNHMISDRIEVADIPGDVLTRTFDQSADEIKLDQDFPEGVLNAPPVLVEINSRLEACEPGSEPYVINLTLLPQTGQDLSFLDDQLGRGSVTILSRGYGNCRIRATDTRHVWWVQYFNSQDTSILNSLEISTVPAVACAAQEDIADSADRLHDILKAYQ